MATKHTDVAYYIKYQQKNCPEANVIIGVNNPRNNEMRDTIQQILNFIIPIIFAVVSNFEKHEKGKKGRGNAPPSQQPQPLMEEYITKILLKSFKKF